MLTMVWLLREIQTIFITLNQVVYKIMLYTNLGNVYAALIWQKEAGDKSDISCKRAKHVYHFHWRQWNSMMSNLT